MTRRVPVVDYLVLDEVPHLRAHECANCRALYFDRRNACARCFTTEFGTRDLSNEGRLRAFTFVARTKRPYVSAIVDLEGGGVVKANLLGVDEPDEIRPGLPLVLTTLTAGTDDDGTEAVAFGYRPQGGEK